MKLKPCPACKSPDVNITPDYNDFVVCLSDSCRMTGPTNDPTGEKWNALPRAVEFGDIQPIPAPQVIVPTAYTPSRRDYFAAAALASMDLFDPALMEVAKRNGDTDCAKCAADIAVFFADCVIARLDATEVKP